MIKIKKLLILLVITSCNSTVKGSWTCPTLEGGKGNCISIKEADLTPKIENKADISYLGSKQKIEINLIAPKISDLKKLQLDRKEIVKEEVAPVKPKLRSQERVGKIWFAPYIDSEGYQHSESTIYVVDEESKWMIQQ
jgi:type IV conjugative transfer system lipoprotein TraV